MLWKVFIFLQYIWKSFINLSNSDENIQKCNPSLVFISQYFSTPIWFLKVTISFGTKEYFPCSLYQMLKPLIHSSVILRNDKYWEYCLNYSDDHLNPLRSLAPWVKSHFLNTAFHKLVYTYFIFVWFDFG